MSVYISDSQRSEERKQQRVEEVCLESNLQHKERDRKRKLTALPVKVSPVPLHTAINRVAKILFFPFFFLSSLSRLSNRIVFFLPPIFIAPISRFLDTRDYRFILLKCLVVFGGYTFDYHILTFNSSSYLFDELSINIYNAYQIY